MLACTAMQPVEMGPDNLHHSIRTEGIVAAGDKIKVVTANGQRHTFVVASIGVDEIRGSSVEVSIEEIVALQNGDFKMGETKKLPGLASEIGKTLGLFTAALLVWAAPILL